MITEDYVSFETAKLLKEKGFNQQSDWGYDKDGRCVEMIDYPSILPEYYGYTLQTIIKWLRDVHNLFIEIQCYGVDANEKAHFEYSYIVYEQAIYKSIAAIPALDWRKGKSQFIRYEEAEEAAIKYCLENLI